MSIEADGGKHLVSNRGRDTPTSGIADVVERAGRVKDVVRLEQGEPDFDVPEHVRRAAEAALKQGHTHYTIGAGLLELREEIARKFLSDNALEYDPETQILVTSGSSTALNLALMAVVNPGNEVLVPSPGWAQYEACVKLSLGIPIFYSLKEENNCFKLDSDYLRAKITENTKAVIICSPSNPTGSILSDQELLEVASIAEENDLVVISDEIYEKITYDGAMHKSVAALDGMAERTITINGFSKTYAMTGWRLGYAGGPSEIIEAMTRLNSTLNMCASSIAQHAGLEALAGPQHCVQEMLHEYVRRRDYLLDRIHRIPTLTCPVPKGAFYAFPNIKAFGISSLEFCTSLLDQAKVAIVPGSAFGPFGEGYVRISYANSMDTLSKGMDRIEATIGVLKTKTRM